MEPKCPSVDQWIMKMWYIATMELCSVVKKDTVVKFAGKWMDLESMISSEVTETWKGKNHIFFHVYSNEQMRKEREGRYDST